jgi:hypothetical protein
LCGSPTPSQRRSKIARAVALFALYYNFVHTRVAFGVTKKLRKISDMVAVLKAWEATKEAA